jgi:hypothetical protein
LRCKGKRWRGLLGCASFWIRLILFVVFTTTFEHVQNDNEVSSIRSSKLSDPNATYLS